MIKIKELKEKSLQLGIPIETVDKDWVLGHLLNGIYLNNFLKRALIFKGGTCLKKLYFPDFRFSEDLDFSAVKEIGRDKIKTELSLIHYVIYQNVGIAFGSIQDKDVFSNDELMAYEFKIPFWGANHPKQKSVPSERWLTSIKIDLSLKEKILMQPVLKNIYHQYSDKNEINAEVTAYCLDEIYSEKLRSVLQRFNFPRDYYDLWYMSRYCSKKIYWEKIPKIFKEKCRLKSIDFKNVNDFFNEKALYEVEKAWMPSMGNHLKKEQVPDFKSAAIELKEKLRELFDERVF
ncbi:MAG: nucleotidyl transferase AbiEii/AbiGii toxin family protein [Candidatus Omnitrophota bacterium]